VVTVYCRSPLHLWVSVNGVGRPAVRANSCGARCPDLVSDFNVAQIPFLVPNIVAVPGLAVGLLVRHLEDAGWLLDRYLTEPDIWHLEFARLTHENSGLGGSSEGIVQPERRRWSLREAGMLLGVHADVTRAEELRAIGGQLVAAARRLVTEALGEDADEETVERYLATVRSSE
jgi:hypothetical protein